MFVKVSRFRPLFDLDRLMNDTFSGSMENGFVNTRFPAVDIAEDESGFELAVELPGVKKEDVRISLEQGKLVLRGERKHYGFPEGTKVLLHETNTVPFERTFQMPEIVDGNAVTAAMKDGILRIRLPKTEQARPREIRVQ